MPTQTKAQLEAVLDQVADLVEEALDPELTREELVAKVKEIESLVSDEDDDAEDGDYEAA